MLIGEYHQNIDAKGRINIPAKFRLDLGESFVVAKGLDNCVYLYPKAAWERFEEELCSVQPTQRQRCGGMQRRHTGTRGDSAENP